MEPDDCHPVQWSVQLFYQFALFVLTITKPLALHGQCPIQLKVPTAGPDKHRILPLLQSPLLHDNVPDTQISPRQRESDSLCLVRRQCKTIEATQLSDGRIGDTDVELRYFVPKDIARVGDSGRDVEEFLPQFRVAALNDGYVWIRQGREIAFCSFDLEIGILESRVRKTETEFEAWFDAVLVKGAVVDVDAFGEVLLGESIERNG